MVVDRRRLQPAGVGAGHLVRPSIRRSIKQRYHPPNPPTHLPLLPPPPPIMPPMPPSPPPREGEESTQATSHLRLASSYCHT